MMGNVPRKQDLADFIEHRSSCDTRTGFEMKREEKKPKKNESSTIKDVNREGEDEIVYVRSRGDLSQFDFSLSRSVRTSAAKARS